MARARYAACGRNTRQVCGRQNPGTAGMAGMRRLFRRQAGSKGEGRLQVANPPTRVRSVRAGAVNGMRAAVANNVGYLPMGNVW